MRLEEQRPRGAVSHSAVPDLSGAESKQGGRRKKRRRRKEIKV